MNEDDLRQLIRASVERHLAARPSAPGGGRIGTATEPDVTRDPSHAQYVTVVNFGDACVIEPSVPCNHCGYCKSHGH
jgi:hypothetical protein